MALGSPAGPRRAGRPFAFVRGGHGNGAGKSSTAGAGLPPDERLPQPHHVVLPRPERPARAAERRYLDTRRALAEANATARQSASHPVPAPAHGTELTGFFVNWDDTSFTSLKENIRSLDRLMPEWLHLTDGTGTIDLDQPARQQDVMAFVARAKPGLRIVPLVNNFDSATVQWQSAVLATMLASPRRADAPSTHCCRYVRDRHVCRRQSGFRKRPHPQPLSSGPVHARTARGFSAARARGLAVRAARRSRVRLSQLARACDCLILMAYDEHTGDGDAGSVASQAWFSQTARAAGRGGDARIASLSRSAAMATTGLTADTAPKSLSRRRARRRPSRRVTPDSTPTRSTRRTTMPTIGIACITSGS